MYTENEEEEAEQTVGICFVGKVYIFTLFLKVYSYNTRFM